MVHPPNKTRTRVDSARPPKARTMLAMTTDDDDDDHRCGCGLASSIPVNSYEYPSERLSRADEHHAIKRPRKHLLTFSPSSSFVHRRSRGHRVWVTRRALLRSWFPPRKRQELRCQRESKRDQSIRSTRSCVRGLKPASSEKIFLRI